MSLYYKDSSGWIQRLGAPHRWGRFWDTTSWIGSLENVTQVMRMYSRRGYFSAMRYW